MTRLDAWTHCPRCTALLRHENGRVECAECGFVEYANSKPTASAVIVDDEPVDAQVAVVSNNDYTLELLSLGERERLDEGLLHLYLAPGWRVSEWDERASASLTVDAARHRIKAAVDGEPAVFETPLAFSIQPLALRVLVPPAQG